MSDAGDERSVKTATPPPSRRRSFMRQIQNRLQNSPAPVRFNRLAASLRLPHYCGRTTITKPGDDVSTPSRFSFKGRGDTRSLPRQLVRD